MARTITVNKTNTMNAWRQKTQQLSDWLGDIDDIELTDSLGFPDNKYIHSYVDGLNEKFDDMDYLERLLFDSIDTPNKPIFGKTNANFLVDSGVFDLLKVSQLWNYDSAMNGPQNDDADSNWYGDTPATPAFDFVADSVHINDLYVVDASFIDSAQVYKRVNVHEWTQINDSIGTNFTADKVTFTKYVDINTLRMDNQVVSLVRPFYINKPDGIKANAHFAGYMLDSIDGHMAMVTPDFTLS